MAFAPAFTCVSAPLSVRSSPATCVSTTAFLAPLRLSHAVPRRAARCPGILRMDAADSSSKGSEAAREVPFEIRGFSLANVGLALGAAVTLVSFSSYFNSNGTASATSLGFVYGVPILLIGCALKYAELEPVPLSSEPAARAMRDDGGATETQVKIVNDVTRHRYGDEAHLSAAVSALGLVPRGAACPELLRISERVKGGNYVLGMEFYSVETPYKQWTDRLERMERFFGPGVKVEVEKLDGEKRLVELRLVSTGDASAGSTEASAATAGAAEE